MAAVESYSPCPCGSGQKFKWCCQKVESYADKAQRLFDSGQVDAAIKALDEGLRKEPTNPWLLTRKAVMQIRNGQAGGAKSTLRQVLEKNPKHFGALILLTRCVLETEGPINGAGMFQQVLASVEDDQRASLATLARVVAFLLGEFRRYPAALKHLELVRALGDPDGSASQAIRSIESNPNISPWLKDNYPLAPTPTHWTGDGRARFEQALTDASRGLWASAAGAFDLLSGGEPGGEADYNLGLCRLWLGDEVGAVDPLRRRVGRLGTSAEAVDLEALCQMIAPVHPDDRVEQVQLVWPLRNRDALLAALQAAPDVADDGEDLDDPDNLDSVMIAQFVLLDRPALPPESSQGLSPDQIPRIVGRIGVSPEVAALETYDDGRVDALGDRFTVLAGASIVPAHPRTNVVGVAARSNLALTWEWLTPEDLEQAEGERLDREKRAQILMDVWPKTPMPYLGFRTPEQAARDGNAEVPLRAALLQFERDQFMLEDGKPLPLRERLGVRTEPAIDPTNVDIVRVPLARLSGINPAELDDESLVTLYRRVRRAMMPKTMEETALAIVARPHLFEQGQVDPVAVYADLASIAAGLRDAAGVQTWIAAGRRADTPATKGRNAPIWDMVEVRLRARIERPDVWVPELAIVLERYAGEPSANQVILMNLVEMGLVEMAPNPDNPNDVLLDSRPLQAVMAEFGPRVTTSSGRLGVSATKPDLWTPGGPSSSSNASGGGGLWTPGSTGAAASSASQGDKPKLILPGR